MKNIFYIIWMLGAVLALCYGMFIGIDAITFSEQLSCLGWMLAGLIQFPLMWELA